MKKRPKAHRTSEAGFSFIELVIATVIITTVFLGAVVALKNVFSAVTGDRVSWTMQELVQQKINELRKRSYDELPVITAPTEVWPSATENFIYDPINFPPQTVTVGQRKYTVYVVIEKTTNASQSTYMAAADMGLKAVNVTVTTTIKGALVMKKGSWLAHDPNKKSNNGVMTGTVRDDLGNPVQATIFALEQPAYRVISNAMSGTYMLTLPEGTWTFSVYNAFTDPLNTAPITITPLPNQVNQDFVLNKRSTGTVFTNCYYADKPIISQVGIISNSPTTRQYVELFNPMAVNLLISSITLQASYDGTTTKTMALNAGAVAVIPAKSYYLIANQTGTVNGKTPDAVTTDPNLVATLPGSGRGSIKLSWGSKFDAVGWYDSSGGPIYPPVGTYFITPVGIPGGFQVDKDITRAVSTGTYVRSYAGDSNLYGAAYNYSKNSVDFQLTPIATIGPNCSLDGPAVLVAANVAPYHQYWAPGPNHTLFWTTDGYSQLGQSFGYPSGVFVESYMVVNGVLPGVRTFQYNVSNASSEQYEDPNPIVVNVSTGMNPATDVVTPVARAFAPCVIANMPITTNLKGSIALSYTDGKDFGIDGIPIILPDRAQPCITNNLFNYYFVTAMATGTYNAIYNSGPFRLSQFGPPFVSTFTVSQATQWDKQNAQHVFTLSGTIRTGTPLAPGNPVGGMYIRVNDNVTGATINGALTKSDGTYSIVLQGEKNYRIGPRLTAGQTMVDPPDGTTDLNTAGYTATTVVPNIDFYVDVITYGNVVGKVQNNGSDINEGLIVMVSTSTIPGSQNPPDISPSQNAQGMRLFSGISSSDGTYSISVPVGNNYYLSSWYNGVKKEYSNITVNAGASTTQDILWP